jgi:predicted DCC family thiol-disulfide oxidoreductase YuxK
VSGAEQPDGRTVVLYDEDCGFCRWALGWILRWDRSGQLRPVSLQSAEAETILTGMDPQKRMASWHLLDPEAGLHSAGAAFPPLLRRLPGGRPLATFAAAAPGAVNRAYGLVARNRSRIGPRVRRRGVARADELIEQAASRGP